MAERHVLRCFADGVGRYRVFVDGTGKLKQQYFPPDGSGPKDQAPPEAVRQTIDTLVYYDDARLPFFVLPLFPRSLTQLRLQDSKIEVSGRLRCLVIANPQVVMFSNELTLKSGKLHWNFFRLRGLLGNQTFKNIVGVPLEDLTKHEFVAEFAPPPPRLPVIASVIGINAPSEGDTSPITAQFKPTGRKPAVDDGDEAPPRFRLQFEVIRLMSGTPQLKQFLIKLDDPRIEQNRPVIRLQQRAPVSAAVPKSGSVAPYHWLFTAEASHNAVSRFWNDAIVAPYVDALQTVQDGRPVSLIPRFGAREDTWWMTTYSVLEKNHDNQSFDDNDVVIKPPLEAPVDRKVTLVARSLAPHEEKVLQPVEFPAFTTVALNGDRTTPLQAVLELTATTTQDEHELTADSEGFVFTARHVPAKGADQRVRMGAIDLVFPGADPDQPLPSNPEVEEALAGVVRAGTRVEPDHNRRIVTLPDMVLRLGLRGVAPGSQDDVPGEEYATELESLGLTEPEYDRFFRRETPLVIERGERKSPENVQLLLEINESAFEQNSQTLAMRLRKGGLSAASSANANTELIVIDREPFLVAKVELENFEHALSDALTDELGNWSNRSVDGAQWEMSAGASGFVLRLPPQGMGETMERRKGDFQENTPADMRFTPNARLALRSSFFRQRFAEAPWNLRRVLGFPGQRAPGAGVDDVQFELLYGLSARVTYPHLRLAELSARLGFIRGRQSRNLPWNASSDQAAQYRKSRDLWKHLFSAIDSRLAILEPWDTHERNPLFLTDKEGLTYHLRKTAKLRYPVDPPAEPGPGIPNHADGLRGGVAWGFESANIYNAVWRDPKSSSGQLARPYFSALGGWGFQKASFDRNLSSIYSDTAMGRTFSITIERIGRISVCWNRAKHVIVYERTVAGSRQFDAQQDKFLEGIPVLRKVREYVELIEDERRFDDERWRGFMRACRFPAGSKQIAVDSAWGGDVGKTGWQVPLWVRDAAPSDVYPKPQIFFEMAGEAGDKPCSRLCEQPEKLRFYTSTDINLPADPDQWPAVEGIDFAVIDEAELEAPPAPFGSKPAPPAVQDPTVRPSLERFTFRLAPAPNVTNLVADRADEALSGVLRNVTLMRALRTGAVSAVQKHALEMQATVTNAIERALAAPLTEVAKLRDNLKTVQTAIDALKAGKIDLCEELGARAESVVDTGAKQIEAQLFTQLNLWRAELLAVLRKIRDTHVEYNDAAKTALRDKIQELAKALREFVRHAAGTIGEIPKKIDDARKEVARAVTDLKKQIDDAGQRIGALFADLANNKAKIVAEIERLRVDVRDGAGRVDNVLAQAPRQIVGDRLDAVRAKIAAAAQNVDNILVALVAESQRLEASSKAKIAAQIADLKAAVDKLHNDSDAAAKDLAAAIEVEVGKQSGALYTAIDEVEKELLAAVDEAATQVGNEWDTFLQRVEDLTAALLRRAEALVAQHVRDLKAQVRANVKALCNKLVPNVDDLFKDLLKELDPLLDALKNITGEELRRELESLQSRLAGRLGELVNMTLPKLPGITIDDRVFRLIRAFGEPPRVPNLDFKLPDVDLGAIGYYFWDRGRNLLPRVDLTPIVAAVNEGAKDVLNSVSALIPTRSLLDRVLPDKLSNFDLSSIFPNFAGIKLEGLFSNLKMPQISDDRVRVTHGFDAQTMSGWIQMDVDVPYTEPTTVFSLAGVTIRLNHARFQATARVEGEAGRAPRRAFRATMSGDWELQIGGFDVAAIVDTRLHFDDSGRLRFEISPDRVKLQAVLRFVSDLMSSFGYSDSGFSIKPMLTGVQCLLDLPLPPVQMGTFGIANLHLGFLFQLAFESGDFVLSTHLFVGSKKAPFTLTVFILGGAGWVDVGLHYIPAKNELRSTVSIGITAAASLAIALGPIRGGVYAYFGIVVEYDSRGGGNLTIGLLLLFRGEVSLLGFLTVQLALSLEALYTSDGGLIGRGHVSYKIKICWCFTLEVSTSVEYRFGGSGGGSALAGEESIETADSYTLAAREYLGMFA